MDLIRRRELLIGAASVLVPQSAHAVIGNRRELLRPRPLARVPNALGDWLLGADKLNFGSSAAIDIGTGAHNGVLTGLTSGSLVAGHAGAANNALSFDGSTSVVDIADAGAFAFANTTFTVTGWFKTTAGVTGYIASKDAANAGWAIQANAAGTVAANTRSTSAGIAANRTSVGIYNNGAWHFVAAVITTNTVTAGSNNISLMRCSIREPTLAPLSMSRHRSALR
jgi:hypothetical protein